jgi:hypothetical protein
VFELNVIYVNGHYSEAKDWIDSIAERSQWQRNLYSETDRLDVRSGQQVDIQADRARTSVWPVLNIG